MLDPTSLSARRILVVAPHPDDESLGCGGLMALLGDAGRALHTVFVTDGGASHRNSKEWPRARLAAAREAEGAEALERLGLGHHPRTYLRLLDADMPSSPSAEWDATLSAFTALAAAFDPDLVLVPWRRDPHRDHRDSWTLATESLKAANKAPRILEYAIWLDELGSAEDQPAPGEMRQVVFDIAPALERKRAAVAAHLTQTTTMIDDDPDAFRLTRETIARLTGPGEAYWEAAS